MESPDYKVTFEQISTWIFLYMWLAFTQAHAQAAEKTLATCKNKMELLKSVTHPTEFWALLKFQYGGGKDHIMPKVDKVCSIIIIYN